MENSKINLFIALDGSEHALKESCEQANEEYWKKIIPESSEFTTIDGKTMLVKPEAQIEYYKNILGYLTTQKLLYSDWFKHFELLTRKITLNNITPELAVLYAKSLLGAFVIPSTPQDERNRIDHSITLLGIINEFRNNEETKGK